MAQNKEAPATPAEPLGQEYTVPGWGTYRADVRAIPALEHKDNSGRSMSEVHSKSEWSDAEVDSALKDNCIYAWGASDPLHESCVPVTHGEGIYLYGRDGKKYVDLSSGAICSNLGSDVPASVKDAMTKQISEAPFVYGDLATTEARAKMCKLLADISPGDIDGFIFASSGAEANEAAIRMARRYTGRYKVMTRYRSYHGGTSSTLSMTGDPRTWAADTTTTGFVKIMDPFPITFNWAESPPAAIELALHALEEQILAEGPSSVACIVLEAITGANGWLVTPPRYMQGVRALCDRYGILLIADEVMNGFGRTGKLFGFQNYEGVLPDMYSFAKGVTASWVPLSGVGVRKHIQDHFRTNPVGYGSTYSAHPLAMATGYAVVRHILEKDIPARVKALEPVMAEEMDRIVSTYISARQARVIGLAGGIDVGGLDGNFIMDMHQAHPGVAFLKKTMVERGIMTLMRGHHLHVAPPLIITEEEIRSSMATLGECFAELDKFLLANK